MTRTVLTPAKINLGLEVIARRPDGFHDIATVFQTISVFDRLRITASDFDSVQIINSITQIESNLVTRALEIARERGLTDRAWQIELEKRIPVAAGLGGASSDAAAVLLALEELQDGGRHDLAAIALELGSDVPFLLQGGAALAGGRGERLEPLPAPRASWLVLAVPAVELQRKTARLYGALRVEDFSDGSRVDRVARALRDHRAPDAGDLANAFERPLAVLLPEIDHMRAGFQEAGAPFVALSGAGPAHYTIVPTLTAALRLAMNLQTWADRSMRVMIARPTASGPLWAPEKTIDSFGTL